MPTISALFEIAHELRHEAGERESPLPKSGIDAALRMHYSASIMRAKRAVEHFVAVFQALSEPTRLRIMALLCRAGRELCVCEFVDALEEPQYHISRSLKILHKAGLVSERREGKWVHYNLPSGLDEFAELTVKAITAIPEEVQAKDQHELARRLKLRENGKCLLGVQKTYLLSRRNRTAQSKAQNPGRSSS